MCCYCCCLWLNPCLETLQLRSCEQLINTAASFWCLLGQGAVPAEHHFCCLLRSESLAAVAHMSTHRPSPGLVVVGFLKQGRLCSPGNTSG